MTKPEQYRSALVRALRSNKLRTWGRGGRGARIARLAAKLLSSLNRRKKPHQERYYTPAEVGAAWGLSDNTVRRVFDREPGVIRRNRSNPRNGNTSRYAYRSRSWFVFIDV
jgi:hypothetical protein